MKLHQSLINVLRLWQGHQARQILIKQVTNKHLYQLAELGGMSKADMSVHAQVLPQAVRQDLINSGLLRLRPGTPITTWTTKGVGACADAKREVQRQQKNRQRLRNQKQPTDN